MKSATLPAAFLAAALALAATTATAQGCAPVLTVDDAPKDTAVLLLSAPCDPYTQVRVTLGALRFDDETDQAGTLRVTVPRLGGVASVTVAGRKASARVPPHSDPSRPVSAVLWPDGARWGLPGATVAESGTGVALYRLGFPGAGQLADVLVGAPMARLDIVLTADSCGRSVTARIVTGSATRDLSVALPACDGPSGSLRVQLTP